MTEFIDTKGMINMRGPETAQYGLTLSLLARYLNYTSDTALIQKHRAKIEATAAGLLAMHDNSLKLPPDDRGYGLIAGWSESDACLAPHPEIWWKPYYANSAFAARGLRDLEPGMGRLQRQTGAGLEAAVRCAPRCHTQEHRALDAERQEPALRAAAARFEADV